MSTRRTCQAAIIAIAAIASAVTTVTATASSAPLRSAKPGHDATAVPDHWTGVTPTGTPTDPPEPAPVYRAPRSSSPVKWDGATVAITSDTRHGTTRSPIVRYVATVHGVCGLRDGETEPCPLPTAGKLTWQVLGAEAGLSWAYRSAPLARCSVTITLRRPVGGCAVDWGVYGDQTIAATYRSTPTGAIADEVTSTVRIVAPVDLGRMQYRLDGNAHIGDCTLATAADWVQTTTGVTPTPAAVVGDYWAAMRADGYGHHDVGLSMSQLWSFWRSHPIDGTRLASVKSLPVGAVGAQLADGHPLIASASLPADFGFDEFGGGEHLWLIVGDTNYGPLIVTWGTEAQLSWAQFGAMTDGIWAIKVTTS